MSLLSALFVLATPFFGFALTPPSPSALSLPTLAQLDETVDVSAGAAEIAPAEEAGEDEAEDGEAAPARDEAELGELAAQIRQRQELGIIHRAFGIATWASMLVTVGLGFIQYYNLYGFFGSQADNPCVNGNAIFGQDQCYGDPWPHRIAAIATTALYSTSFVLSFVLPIRSAPPRARRARTSSCTRRSAGSTSAG